MMDDLFADLFGDADLDELGKSRRAQRIVRWVVGLLGAGLLGYGTIRFALHAGPADNLAMRTGMAALLASLACCFLFNVALARMWRWPAAFAVLSLVALVVSRLAWGP